MSWISSINNKFNFLRLSSDYVINNNNDDLSFNDQYSFNYCTYYDLSSIIYVPKYNKYFTIISSECAGNNNVRVFTLTNGDCITLTPDEEELYQETTVLTIATTLPIIETTFPLPETTILTAITTLPEIETSIPISETLILTIVTTLPIINSTISIPETTNLNIFTTIPKIETTIVKKSDISTFDEIISEISLQDIFSTIYDIDTSKYINDKNENKVINFFKDEYTF